MQLIGVHGQKIDNKQKKKKSLKRRFDFYLKVSFYTLKFQDIFSYLTGYQMTPKAQC